LGFSKVAVVKVRATRLIVDSPPAGEIDSQTVPIKRREMQLLSVFPFSSELGAIGGEKPIPIPAIEAAAVSRSLVIAAIIARR